MSEPTFQQLLLTNPLTEETRKERRDLLAVSALGIVMMKTGRRIVFVKQVGCTAALHSSGRLYAETLAASDQMPNVRFVEPRCEGHDVLEYLTAVCGG
jgi:hypothetical protein